MGVSTGVVLRGKERGMSGGGEKEESRVEDAGRGRRARIEKAEYSKTSAMLLFRVARLMKNSSRQIFCFSYSFIPFYGLSTFNYSVLEELAQVGKPISCLLLSGRSFALFYIHNCWSFQKIVSYPITRLIDRLIRRKMTTIIFDSCCLVIVLNVLQDHVGLSAPAARWFSSIRKVLPGRCHTKWNSLVASNGENVY